MAEKQELEISIAADGTVHIDVHGAKGKKCLDLTKDIEEALGTVTARETKSSYYENGTNVETTIRGTGQ